MTAGCRRGRKAIVRLGRAWNLSQNRFRFPRSLPTGAEGQGLADRVLRRNMCARYVQEISPFPVAGGVRWDGVNTLV